MKPRPQLGKFLARAADGEAELFIYDQIGGSFFSEGVTAKQVAAAVAECEQQGAKKLAIYINSPGGDVFQGMAILNCLKRFSGEKVVYVDGLAASIASIIAMAGDRRFMGSGAMMMVHDPSAFASDRGVGTAAEMRAKAEDLDKIAGAMASAYAERTHGDESAMRTLMRAETWMTAAEAVERGFADETFEQQPDQDATAFLKSPVFASFHNVPAPLLALAKTSSGHKPDDKEQPVMFKALLAKLGLSDSATEAQAIVAFDAMVGTSRKLIEITGAATEAQALGTVTAWKASHDQVADLNARVQKAEAEKAQAEVKALVDAAIKDGKAAPAQRDSLMLMTPEALKAFVAAAPVIHKPHTDKAVEMDATTLTAEELDVCRKMNRDPKDFLASKKKAIEEGRAPSAGTLQLLATSSA
jgi:ATP-dependent Clp protease protease subunit